MSADIGGQGEGTPEGHKCPEGQIWSEEKGKCVKVEQESDKNIPAGSGEVTSSLIEQIVKTVNQHIEKKLAAWNKEIDKKIQQAQKQVGSEIQTGLRKSLGLQVDPPVHMSDLAEFGRKLQLETSKHGKRTPASKMAGVGPDGNKEETGKTATSKKIEGIFKEYGFKGEKN